MKRKDNTTIVDKTIGQRLRALRASAGMSQEKLGELLDVTFQQIQKYEKGTNRISMERLLIVARHFGVEITHFSEGLEKAAATCAALDAGNMVSAEFFATPGAYAVARSFIALDNKRRQAVRTFLRELAA